MSNFDWKTKKEKIIENARKDPFLKIEDLAKLANTTSRYVRTILSEANVSLMQLRKEYAHKMENKNDNLNDKLLFSYLLNVPFTTNKQILIMDELFFNNPQDLNFLSGNIKEKYFFQSYVHLFKDKSWCISTFLLNKEVFTVKGERLSATELFTRITNTLIVKNLQISNIDLEIELANNQVAKLLEISPLSPVFRVMQTLEDNLKIRALMLVYFDSRKINLSLSYHNGLVIKRKNIAG